MTYIKQADQRFAQNLPTISSHAFIHNDILIAFSYVELIAERAVYTATH